MLFGQLRASWVPTCLHFPHLHLLGALISLLFLIFFEWGTKHGLIVVLLQRQRGCPWQQRQRLTPRRQRQHRSPGRRKPSQWGLQDDPWRRPGRSGRSGPCSRCPGRQAARTAGRGCGLRSKGSLLPDAAVQRGAAVVGQDRSGSWFFLPVLSERLDWGFQFRIW